MMPGCPQPLLEVVLLLGLMLLLRLPVWVLLWRVLRVWGQWSGGEAGGGRSVLH